MATKRIKTVYLVDDSDDEIFMAKIFFKRQNIGLDLVAFSNLESLYDLIENSADFEPMHSMIVLDLNLTVCKGTDGLIYLRKTEIGKSLFMGISTGSEDPADKILAKEAGADFCVSKPLDRQMILAVAANVPEVTAQEDEGHVLNLYRG